MKIKFPNTEMASLNIMVMMPTVQVLRLKKNPKKKPESHSKTSLRPTIKIRRRFLRRSLLAPAHGSHW